MLTKSKRLPSWTAAATEPSCLMKVLSVLDGIATVVCTWYEEVGAHLSVRDNAMLDTFEGLHHIRGDDKEENVVRHKSRHRVRIN